MPSGSRAWVKEGRGDGDCDISDDRELDAEQALLLSHPSSSPSSFSIHYLVWCVYRGLRHDREDFHVVSRACQ